MRSVLDRWGRLVEHRRFLAYCRVGFGLGALFCALWMASHVVFATAFGPRLLEDAYFFTRYAYNFLHTGVFSWNAGEPAAFGNTAQLYQIFIALLFWLTGEKQVLSLLIGSVSGGVAAAAVVMAAYWRLWGRDMPRLGWIMLPALLLYFFAQQNFIRTMDTGMETGWAAALVGAGLWSAFHLERQPSPRAVLTVVVWALLLYLTRPDAVLLPLVTLAGAGAFCRDRDRRRFYALAIVGAVGGLVAIVALEWLYYGSPVPLSAYGKLAGLTIYPPTLLDVYRHAMARAMLQFVQENTLLLLPLAALLWQLRRVGAVTRGALLALAAFFSFHGLFTIPIMDGWLRFLMPALPLVVLLAMQGVHLLVSHGVAMPEQDIRRRLATPLFAAALLAVLIARVPWAVALHGADLRAQRHAAPYVDDRSALVLASHYTDVYLDSLPRLAAAIDKSCSVASTEHGRLSALLLDNRMIDLAGLHDAEIARRGFSASLVLERYRPDVLFAPHVHYIEWTRQLLAHPLLQRDYEIIPLSGEEGHLLALRRDSPCYAKLRPIYRAGADRR